MNGNMDGDVVRSEAEPPSLPRKVKLSRGSEGYGFNLHGEKGIHGQYISAIDEGSPAQLNDVRVGDRVIAVNNEDVEDLPHSKVVERIRAGGNEVILLVVDEKCDEFYKALGVKIPQDKYENVSAKDAEQKGAEEEKASEEEAVAANVVQGEQVASSHEQQAEEAKVSTNVEEPVQQNGAVVASGEAEEDVIVESEAKPVESVKEDEKFDDDAYEDVVPLAANKEVIAEPVVAEVAPKVETPPPPPTTTTTTPSSAELDMAAARPKPKRNEVKKASHNWKQKYEDFNKL